MALTATASQGLEFVRHIAPTETMWIPGDPGDTYTRGDLVTATVGEGVVDPASTNEAPIGVVHKTVVCTAAATAGFPVFGPGQSRGMGQVPDDQLKTLVEIIPFAPAGAPIFKCTFQDHQDDENITAYTAATPSITTAVAGNDYHDGALVYVYGGPGEGQWNVISDSVNATSVNTLHRIFNTALTTASDVIILAGQAAANRGVGFFNRTGMTDASTLEVDDHADNGTLTVFLDARNVGEYLSVLQLPVIASALLHLA